MKGLRILKLLRLEGLIHMDGRFIPLIQAILALTSNRKHSFPSLVRLQAQPVLYSFGLQ